jgi:hypothetical protein
MSQFDKANFFNQVFWLVVLFGSFYFILLRNFLPKLSAVIKARRKKVTLGVQASEKFNEEESVISGFYNDAILNLSGNVRNSANLVSEKSSNWSADTHKSINLNTLTDSQLSYLTFYKNINSQKQYSL